MDVGRRSGDVCETLIRFSLNIPRWLLTLPKQRSRSRMHVIAFRGWARWFHGDQFGGFDGLGHSLLPGDPSVPEDRNLWVGVSSGLDDEQRDAERNCNE